MAAWRAYSLEQQLVVEKGHYWAALKVCLMDLKSAAWLAALMALKMVAWTAWIMAVS